MRAALGILALAACNPEPPADRALDLNLDELRLRVELVAEVEERLDVRAELVGDEWRTMRIYAEECSAELVKNAAQWPAVFVGVHRFECVGRAQWGSAPPGAP